MQLDLHDLQALTLAEFFGHIHHLGGLKLDNLPTAYASKVIMRPVPLDGLEMAMTLSKLVFIHQADLLQECQGSINSRQADACIPFSGLCVNRLGIQVSLAFIEDFHHELPLAGKPASLATNSFD
jgi:hypothetical protein